MKYLSILLLFITLFTSCKVFQRKNEITKIEFTRSGAWNDFGAVIIIDNKLNYYDFERHENPDKIYYSGKITRAYWDTLCQKLEKIHYKTLDSAENRLIFDANYFGLTVISKTGKKRIGRYSELNKDPLQNVLQWINNSYKEVKLHQINDSVKFEMYFGTILPPPFREERFIRSTPQKNTN